MFLNYFYVLMSEINFLKIYYFDAFFFKKTFEKQLLSIFQTLKLKN
jgi:hypothetical protein